MSVGEYFINGFFLSGIGIFLIPMIGCLLHWIGLWNPPKSNKNRWRTKRWEMIMFGKCMWLLASLYIGFIIIGYIAEVVYQVIA